MYMNICIKCKLCIVNTEIAAVAPRVFNTDSKTSQDGESYVFLFIHTHTLIEIVCVLIVCTNAVSIVFSGVVAAAAAVLII